MDGICRTRGTIHGGNAESLFPRQGATGRPLYDPIVTLMAGIPPADPDRSSGPRPRPARARDRLRHRKPAHALLKQPLRRRGGRPRSRSKALSRARRKAEGAAVAVRLDQGYSDELPYADATFDRVVSSFMFHHLSDDVRRGARQVNRALKPGALCTCSTSCTAGRKRRSHSCADSAAGLAATRLVRKDSMLFGHLQVPITPDAAGQGQG